MVAAAHGCDDILLLSLRRVLTFSFAYWNSRKIGKCTTIFKSNY